MLVGADAPLTAAMDDRMVKVGSTPALLMVGSATLALASALAQSGRRS